MAGRRLFATESMDLESSPSFLNHTSSNTFIRQFFAYFSPPGEYSETVSSYFLFSEPSTTEIDLPSFRSKTQGFCLENFSFGIQCGG